MHTVSCYMHSGELCKRRVQDVLSELFLVPPMPQKHGGALCPKDCTNPLRPKEEEEERERERDLAALVTGQARGEGACCRPLLSQGGLLLRLILLLQYLISDLTLWL